MQGNSIGRSDNAGCDGRGWREDVGYTLNTIDKQAVCYNVRGFGTGGVCGTMTGDHAGRVTDYTEVCIEHMDKNKQYAVRLFTPNECCHLQGFPDMWGVLDFPNEEDTEFWEQARKTYAELNSKAYKPCKDKKALLAWYNKLHSDGAEYKMWGNGIALPNAYYVMQGCVDAIKEETTT